MIGRGDRRTDTLHHLSLLVSQVFPVNRVNGSGGKGLNKRLAGRLPGCRLGWVPGGWAGLAARRLGWAKLG